MRIRTIKPDFWTHPVMMRLDDLTRLVAIALLNVADDEGYFFADEDVIRGAVFPKKDSTKIRRAIDELSRAEFLSVSEHHTHGRIGRIINFRQHQRVDRPNPSKIKHLHDSTNARRIIVEDSTLEQGTGNREQGKDSFAPNGHSSESTQPKIEWSFDHGFSGITDEDRRLWSDAFPAVHIETQLARAHAWLRANPAKAKRSQWRRFISGWLARQQERGGDTRSAAIKTKGMQEPQLEIPTL